MKSNIKEFIKKVSDSIIIFFLMLFMFFGIIWITIYAFFVILAALIIYPFSKHTNNVIKNAEDINNARDSRQR